MQTWIDERWQSTTAGYYLEILEMWERIEPVPWKRLGKPAKGPWALPF